jgi:hypothetical protein
MRYYAPWTCRFINIDPLAPKYPFYTPYQYAGNDPINYIDLDGCEKATSNSSHSNDQQAKPKSSDNGAKTGDKGNKGGVKPKTDGTNNAKKTEGNKTPQGELTGTNEHNYYTVAPGDNLGIIAKQYGDKSKTLKENIDAIAKDNNIADPNHIEPGQKLTISTGNAQPKYQHTEEEPIKSSTQKGYFPEGVDLNTKDPLGPLMYTEYTESGGPFESAQLSFEITIKSKAGSIKYTAKWKEVGGELHGAPKTQYEYIWSWYDLISEDFVPEIKVGLFAEGQLKGDFWSVDPDLLMKGGVSYGPFKLEIDNTGKLRLGIEVGTNWKNEMKGKPITDFQKKIKL